MKKENDKTLLEDVMDLILILGLGSLLVWGLIEGIERTERVENAKQQNR